MHGRCDDSNGHIYGMMSLFNLMQNETGDVAFQHIHYLNSISYMLLVLRVIYIRI